MRYEPEQCSLEEWRENKRADEEQAARISERMYQRYVKDRLDDIPHDDLVDEYGKESAWFKERFEETEKHYQEAMKAKREDGPEADFHAALRKSA